MKTIHLTDPRFAITKQGTFRLKDHVCDLPSEAEKKELKKQLEADKAVISELQEVLYAAGKHSLLLIFQAMDAAGKDSCIRHVMSGVNPQGVQVHSFKAPSTLERNHDFLWRHALAMPPRGFIGIHNRSHYEEVLVTRVHPQFILGQNIPGINSEKDITKTFWEQRYASIRNFEEHLAENGTVIMKFFLHMGKDAQKERFLERIDDPKKNWKFSVNDIKERGHWDAYQEAYEQAIRATAAPHAPWYIIPADEQWESRALVGRLLRLQLEALGLKNPTLDEKAMAGLQDARAALMAEK
ncbi:MAG: polyphosphate kinase 2 family protein [Flavobacteriales bacterium]|nr:polyphosphate kinase 2 family protein [Flavobacteriales bacterium]